MSSTNKTANLELSQFLGSDSPKWLTDYNADMQKIDTAIGAVQSQADATDLVVSGHSSAIESLQTTEGEQGTAIANLRSDVNHNAGDISTINSLIGNGEPTTTDKTIIGAINELDGEMPSTASDLPYVNASSGLTATNVQSAIDELASGGILPTDSYVMIQHNRSMVATHDGTKTNSQLIAELVQTFNSITAALESDQFIRPIRVQANGIPCPLMYFRDFPKNDVCNVQACSTIVNNVPNSADFYTIYISNSPRFISGTFGGSASGTWIDEGAQVATNDMTIFYDVYQKV